MCAVRIQHATGVRSHWHPKIAAFILPLRQPVHCRSAACCPSLGPCLPVDKTASWYWGQQQARASSHSKSAHCWPATGRSYLATAGIHACTRGWHQCSHYKQCCEAPTRHCCCPVLQCQSQGEPAQVAFSACRSLWLPQCSPSSHVQATMLGSHPLACLQLGMSTHHNGEQSSVTVLAA